MRTVHFDGSGAMQDDSCGAVLVAQLRSELVNGQRPITADTALRLGLFFGMEARFWLNLQSEYDIRVADRELRAKLSPRIRVFQPVAG